MAPVAVIKLLLQGRPHSFTYYARVITKPITMPSVIAFPGIWPLFVITFAIRKDTINMLTPINLLVISASISPPDSSARCSDESATTIQILHKLRAH